MRVPVGPRAMGLQTRDDADREVALAGERANGGRDGTSRNTRDRPLDRPATDGGAPSPSETLYAEDERSIEDLITHEQEVEVLRDAIMGLKEQERTVLAMYYFEELKLHEIATVLELTESRVSQIRSKAILRLREKMAPLRQEPERIRG